MKARFFLPCLLLLVAGLGARDSVETWAFQPAEDVFRDDALLDLRYLNESEAGQSGFIRLSSDGESFVRGDGEPIRFWSVVQRIDLYPVPTWTDEEIDHHYRFLAKRGVNLARIFGQLPLLDADQPLAAINESQLSLLHKHVAAAKRHGIYTFISIYWGHEVKFQEDWGVVPGEMAYSMVFWQDSLRQAYKDWFRQVCTEVNPHTGLALKDDPSVAVIQVHNEDSMLFWTFNFLTDRQMEVLGAQFGEWLEARYGSLATARKTWGADLEADRWEAGILQLVGLERLRQREAGGLETRFRDQTRFLVDMQREFYDDMKRFLHHEIGCRQLLNASNWKTADPGAFEDLERYTYAGLSVMAVNRFVTGPHVGDAPGWRITAGDHYQSLSTLKNPLALAVSVRLPVGHPFLITETTWVTPNRWQAEGPFMAAVYMGLTGFDSAMFFNADSVGWKIDPAVDVTPRSMHKWHAMTPQVIGQYPAPALAHRLGYVTEPEEAAVLQRRTLEELIARVPAQPAEEQGFDPNRDTIAQATASRESPAIDPLAFLVGPVKVELDAPVSETRTVALERYIDRESGIVRSMTGEVTLDYKQGFCVVDTPGFQGTAAFFNEAGGTINTTDCRFVSQNEYATVMAVSMDGRPLRQAERILVQVGTVARPQGWAEEPAVFSTDDEPEIEGFRITDIGHAPWRPRVNRMRLELRNPTVTEAIALDPNGNADGAVAFSRAGDWLAFDLPSDTLYVLLRR